jgi:hypothetical protein
MIQVSRSVAPRAYWLSIVASAYFSSAVMPAERRPAAVPPEQLRQQLIESQSRIRAWCIEYESADDNKSGKSHPHRVVAAKAPDYFFHWSTHETPGFGWREDPFQQRLTITPSRSIIERPGHRQFRLLTLAPTDRLPGSMPAEFLFMALGWWQFPKRPPTSLGGKATAALSAIARSPDYIINPWQELVQEHYCHVLECPGHDKLWLDCERGCAILAREVFEADHGVLIQRIEASGHREIKPGIWVPSKFRNITCNRSVGSKK